ncbi:hypothetical protein E2C01_086685 [Portunus trituberculatus]|uniref:Uncharacterized protein n=1 Tax=Portunus trituberculatus TaxID=210409 RepID=A0A5B7JH30_PORTR|nr:hypothetical protein [Portunus trituberculatus]
MQPPTSRTAAHKMHSSPWAAARDTLTCMTFAASLPSCKRVDAA